jgi:putative ABC transport system ATP-binding protein
MTDDGSTRYSGDGPPLLEARNLGRRHPNGTTWLLRDITLPVRGGERFVVTGPSGSGKTLLLRALSLLDPADTGEVCWRGSPIRGDAAPEFRRKAIYLHQRAALSGDTVETALQFPLSLRSYRGRAFDRARIVRWLAELGREEAFLAKPIQDLSGGEV